MTNSPLIPPGDYLRLLSLPAHILTLKSEGGHAFPKVSCAVPNRATVISWLCFPSPAAFISLPFSLSPFPLSPAGLNQSTMVVLH